VSKRRKVKATKSKRTRGADKQPRQRRSDADTNKPPTSPGRPKGARNTLPKGAVAAIRSLRHRVPDTVPQALKDVADEALVVVADILLDKDMKSPKGAQVRLSAARMFRDEVCGPIPKAVDHQHEGGVTLNIVTGVPRQPGDDGAEEATDVLAEMAKTHTSPVLASPKADT